MALLRFSSKRACFLLWREMELQQSKAPKVTFDWLVTEKSVFQVRTQRDFCLWSKRTKKILNKFDLKDCR